MTPCPRSLKELGAPKTATALVKIKVRPLATVSMPRVAMNGLRPATETRSPLTSPQVAPTRVPPEDCERDGEAGLGHHHHADHTRERRHRAHREVYPRGDDHQRHPDGYDGHDRGLGADVEEVVGGEEDGGGEREEDEDDDEGAGGGELGDDLREPLAQGAHRRVLRSLLTLS